MSSVPNRSRTQASARELQIQTLDIRGRQLRVGVWPGNPAKVPLLLFNGIGGTLELMAPFVDTLGDVEVIAFDVPGTGGSAPPRLPYRLWMLARLASRVLDALGYGRVDVLGVSWGGAFAQQFALQNPRRCRRLILAATSQGTLMMPGSLSVLFKMMSPRRYNDPAYREKIFGMIYGGAARTKPELLAKVAAHMRPTSRRGYLLQQLAIAGWTSVPWLPFVRQPTLVMAGDDDPIIPLVNAKLMTRLIPKARLHVLHDGHMFLLSSPDESATAVLGFLGAKGTWPA